MRPSDADRRGASPMTDRCAVCQRPYAKRGNTNTCSLACSQQARRAYLVVYRARHRDQARAYNRRYYAERKAEGYRND